MDSPQVGRVSSKCNELEFGCGHRGPWRSDPLLLKLDFGTWNINSGKEPELV